MKKKVILGVSLGLVVALVATVVTLALVKNSYKPEIDLTPKTLTVIELENKGQFETGEAFATKEKFNDIVELFDESFTQSVLAGLFSGNSAKNIKIKLESLPTFDNGYQITFEYKADMVLKLDGQEYKSDTNSDKQVLFQTIILNVTEQEGYNQICLYAKQVEGNKAYYYQITTVANTENLYDYLSELSYQ